MKRLVLSQRLKPLVGAEPNSFPDRSVKGFRCVCSQVSALIYVYTRTRSIGFHIRSISDAGMEVMVFETSIISSRLLRGVLCCVLHFHILNLI
jgi:hypothetical protein